jgi:hypothetical protein
VRIVTDLAPTEDHPQEGEVHVGGVVLSKVLYWVDDGDHVIASTEFAVTVGAPEFGAAVEKFIYTAADTASYVSELIREDADPTQGEFVDTMQLLRRLAAGYEAEIVAVRRETRLLRLLAGRRRRRGRRGFLPSGPPSSSRPQHV